MKPSSYQTAIFEADLHGNLAVRAAAGSGKTTTLTACVKRRDPEDALVLSFNRSIVSELQDRLPGYEVRTVNSLGHRTLAAYRRSRVQLDDSKFWNLAEPLARDITGTIRGAGYSPKDVREVRRHLTTAADFCRHSLTDPNDRDALLEMARRFDLEDVDEYTVSTYSRALTRLLEQGRAAFLASGTIDYTDQVFLPMALNLKPPKAPRAYVDEVQDFSIAKVRLAQLAAESFCVVGDPRQSIYAFSGADANAWTEMLTAIQAEELPLSICYRCPPSVIRIAQSMVPEIESWEGHPGGTVDVIEARELLDTLAFDPMSVLLSRGNTRLFEVALQLLDIGVRPALRGKDIIPRIAALIKDAVDDWRFFDDQVREFAEAKAGRLAERRKERAAQTLLDLAKAAQTLQRRVKAHSLEDWTAKVNGIFTESAPITLSTIHSFKGAEAARVFLLDFDRLPLSWRGQTPEEKEQERNVFYVGLTRAKRQLILVKKPKLPDANPMEEE